MKADEEGDFKEVPLNDLMTAQLPPPQYVVWPLIPRNQVTLMGGHGGSGKSLVGLTIASHAAAGTVWGPFEVRRGRVLIVSMEDTADILRHRLRNIVNDYGLDPKSVQKNIKLLDCTELEALAVEQNERGRRRLKTTSKAEQILGLAKEYDLVLIDNASDAYAADENVRHLVRAFIRKLVLAVRPTQGAVLLLAHIDKAAAKSGGGGQTYSGSTAWHNSVRSRLAIANGKLKHEKHQFGPLHPEVAIEFNKNGVPFLVDEAALKLREKQQLNDDKVKVLSLLAEAEKSGLSITTSRTGPNNIWKQINALPGFPTSWKKASGGRDRLAAAISALESEGAIRKQTYTNEQRNKREKWVLATSLDLEKQTKPINAQPTN